MVTYTPKPIDTKDVMLPRDMYPLMEELARSIHDIWAQQRIQEGWSYGPERNDEKKNSPDLVPYEKLPETEKDYDRNTSGETLKSIYKLGFSITKRTSGKVMLVGNFSEEQLRFVKEEASKHELTIVNYTNWSDAFDMLKDDMTQCRENASKLEAFDSCL